MRIWAWYNKGYGIGSRTVAPLAPADFPTSPSEQHAFDLGAHHAATAVAPQGVAAVAAAVTKALEADVVAITALKDAEKKLKDAQTTAGIVEGNGR